MMKVDDFFAFYALKMLMAFKATIKPFNITRTLDHKGCTNFSQSQKGSINRI